MSYQHYVMRTTKDGTWFHDTPNDSDLLRRRMLAPYFTREIDPHTKRPVSLRKCVLSLEIVRAKDGNRGRLIREMKELIREEQDAAMMAA